VRDIGGRSATARAAPTQLPANTLVKRFEPAPNGSRTQQVDIRRMPLEGR
jgi:hypothetical protein